MQGLLGRYGQLPSGITATTPVTPGGWSPVTLTNADGSAITLGAPCYISGNDIAQKAQCDGTEAQATAIAICIDVSIAPGATGRFVFGGIITGMSGGVAGTLGYLGPIAGDLVAAPVLTAGQYNVLLGIWQSATKFQFNPQLPILN